VTVPYPAEPESSANNDAAISRHRSTLVQFRGNTVMSRCSTTADAPLPVYCRLREALVAEAAGTCSSPELSIVATNKLNEDFGYDKTFVSPAETFAEMQQSTFCLVPRGDTPSSRRFFSAIAAGCIPVLIADDYTPPFSHALDYSKFSLSFSVRSTLHSPCGLFQELRNVSAARVRKMQDELVSARRQLSYGTVAPNLETLEIQPGGAIDLMLSTVKEAIAEREEFATSLIHGPCGAAVKGDQVSSSPATQKLQKFNEPWHAPSELFFIFAQMRTASTTINSNLEMHPDITMLDEVLRPGEWAEDPKLIRKLRCDLGYCTVEAIRADLAGFARSVALHCPTRFCGMKIFSNHLPIEPIDGHLSYVVEELFSWTNGPGQRLGPRTKVIVLQRNDTAAEYDSLSRAYETGNWGTTPCKQSEKADESDDMKFKAPFTTTLEQFETEKRAWYQAVRSTVGAGPQLAISTEEIVTDAKAATLRALNFLGVKPAEGVDIVAPENERVCAEDA